MSEKDEFEEMIQQIMKERNCTREEAKKEFEPLRQAMKDAQTVFDDYPRDDEGILVSSEPGPKSDIDILIEEGWCENGDGEWADDETIDNE